MEPCFKDYVKDVNMEANANLYLYLLVNSIWYILPGSEQFERKTTTWSCVFGYALNPSEDWKCPLKETNYSSVDYS